ncbi:MAG: Gfo/Idh/MocA family oxidoreductase [Saprospiraceae bacterium]|nr:Gfo/Idh/MocA family oxidoreductase [Saprospiraceae bacterium]
MQAHNFYNDSMEIEPMLRLAVVGLSHDHVHGILRKAQQGKVQIVGIVEKDQALVDRLQARYGFAYDLVYHDLDNMLSATKPDAVTAFNMISQHVDVVEKCAPLGIHVMVEKPLAATLQQARRMEKLAKQHGIHLLTNYETTWYASNTAAQEIISSNGLGTLRKIIFKTGHKGPREIGCSEEFLSWLTDPVLNGGGALTDFGCYGANLTTWLLQGQTPNKVFCTTQQLKPDIYPKVDDEATIVLTYPSCQVIIQASWNWTFGRKDMEIYGNAGYLICKDGSSMVVQEKGKQKASPRTAPKISGASKDPFEFFRKVINVNDAVKPFSPSSLENNLIVIQILEAAKESAQTGKSIHFDDFVRTH